MKIYKSVRSYHGGNAELNKAFADGWQFERASEYIPCAEILGTIYSGFIEYILSKDVPEESCGNRDAIEVNGKDLCDSCSNKGCCVFQHDIVMSYCSFYESKPIKKKK